MEHKKENNTSVKPVNLCNGSLLRNVDLERIWNAIRDAAILMSESEPHLSRMLDDVVISRANLAESLAVRLARRMAREDMQRSELQPLLEDVLKSNE